MLPVNLYVQYTQGIHLQQPKRLSRLRANSGLMDYAYGRRSWYGFAGFTSECGLRGVCCLLYQRSFGTQTYNKYPYNIYGN